jgi:imidazole glycerol phosphate synthase glutamine amidotransferase subunit
MTIGILDFGAAGNVRSVANAFARIGVEAKLVRECEDGLDGLVVPGVGSFSVVPKIASALGEKEEIAKIDVPVLCICLGMQALMEKSEEAESAEGLGMVKGTVRKIRGSVRLPQLGWNKVLLERKSGLFEGIADGEYFYFANSYAAFPVNSGAVIATTEYGERFASAIRNGNVWGVQFHPEKSGRAGERLLKNFTGICNQKVR